MTADLSIGWLHPGQVAGEFCRSLLDCARHPELGPRIDAMTGLLCGPILSQGRTQIVDGFLERDVPWLLMVDADMVFDPSDVLTLLASADPVSAPIVAGLYFGFADKGRLIAEAGWATPDGAAPLRRWGAGELLAVDVAGAGFLLIHRDVFTALAKIHPRPLPWFAESTRGGQVTGEDWEFCARAREAGFPIHVHTGARIGHWKPTVLRAPVSYAGRRTSRENAGSSETAHVPISSTADAALPGENAV